MSFRILLALLALPAFGCTVHTSSTPKPPPLSSALATSDMWPSMSAQSDGQTITIFAALLKGSDFVDLDTGDFLTATIGGGDGVVLARQPSADGKIHYSASFAEPASAADVVIALHRPAGKQEAPLSKTRVAAPFQITSSAPATFRLGDKLAVTIAPAPAVDATASDRMTIALSGPCLADTGPVGVVFDAAGNASLDTTAFKLKDGAAAGCGVWVAVRHETVGTADPSFANAHANPVEGLQARGFQTVLVR